MDAPLYPPATAYEQPRHLPQALSTRTSSLAELLEDPEAKAILEATLPSMSSQTGNEQIALLIEAMSIRNAAALGGVKPAEIDKIEAQFAQINARRGLRP